MSTTRSQPLRVPRRASATLLLLCSLGAALAAGQIGGGGPGGSSQATGAGWAPPWQASVTPTSNFQVNLATGNVLFRFRTSSFRYRGLAPHHELDLHFNTQAKDKAGDYTGGFGLGQGWSSTYGSRLEFPTASTALLTRADGAEVTFELQPGGGWKSQAGSFLELEARASDWVVRDPRQWEFTFDASGNLTQIASASGNAYVFQYTGGRVTRATEPSGRYLTLGYGASNRLESATDSFDSQWTFHYDASGRLDEIVDPEHGTCVLAYDARGRIASYSDLDGHVWTFGYFNTGLFKHRVKRVTSVGGETFRLAYSGQIYHVKTKLTDAGGGIWEVLHDREDSPALASWKTPLGNTWTYVHDANRLLTSRTSPLNETWTYLRDSDGNLVKVTDPLGRFTEYDHDTLRNLTEVSADGATYERHFEDVGHPTSATRLVEPPDEAGNTATQHLEHFGPADGSLPGEWNGLLSRSTDDGGGETRLEYNGYSWPVGIEEGPAGAAGRVEARYDGSTLPSFVDHGGMGYPAGFPTPPPLPSQIQGGLALSPSPATTLTWRGQVATGEVAVQSPIDSGSGWEQSTVRRDYTYDAEGRVLSMVETTEEPFAHVANPPAATPSRAFTVSYDPDRVDVTTPDGDVLTQHYDADQRLTKITSNGGGAGEFDVDYTYFEDGSLQSVLHGDGTSTHYTYEANGLTKTIEHRSGTIQLLRLEYAYDDRNIPVCVTETSPDENVAKCYEYDLRRRLTQELRTNLDTGGSEQWDYDYDSLGNRTRHERRVDGAPVETAVYHYDREDPAAYGSDNGRLTWVEYLGGDGTTPISTTWVLYENPYGNASHVVSRDAGASTYVATVLVYTESGLPWLIWEETWDDFGLGPVNVSRGDVLETRQLGTLSHLWRRRDGQTLAPLGGAEWVTGLGETRASYAVDPADGAIASSQLEVLGLGRVGEGGLEFDALDLVASVRVRSSGGVTELEDYSAFGVRLTTASGLANGGFAGGFGARQAFEGEPFSGDGLVKLGYRFYSPRLGRFVMRDPIGISGGANVYGFVGNLPTALVDPNGLSAQDPQDEQEPESERFDPGKAVIDPSSRPYIPMSRECPFDPDEPLPNPGPRRLRVEIIPFPDEPHPGYTGPRGDPPPSSGGIGPAPGGGPRGPMGPNIGDAPNVTIPDVEPI